MRALVKLGVDIKVKDDAGRTALFMAVVRALVELGADVNWEDDAGRTALFMAAENGHEAVVKLLLATDGVDPDSKDTEWGRTPLSRAAERGHEAVVRLLLATDGVDPDSEDNEWGWTPLSWAARNGHFQEHHLSSPSLLIRWDLFSNKLEVHFSYSVFTQTSTHRK